MKRLHSALITMALGGVSPEDVLSTRSTLCNAADDYETGGDYETVGDAVYDNDGNVVGQMQFRPLARPGMQLARPAARPLQIARPGQPAQRPQQPVYRPPPAPVPSGLTVDQVRRIVAEQIAALTPYGSIPPRPNPEEAMFPMGLGFVVLSGGPPAVLSAGFLNILPQRAFRGERLVLSTLRSSGATTVPVIVDTFKVGDYSQLVGGAAVPVETFAPDSFGVRLMLDGAVPGVTYTVNVSVPAAVGIPAGETITVVGTVIGRTGEAAQR